MSKKRQTNAPQQNLKPNPRPKPASEKKTAVWIDFERLESWLKDHRKWLAGGIVVLSLLLRLVYFSQAKDTPIAGFHSWENSDMAFFDSWAQKLAAGDWLNREAPHPLHTWHQEVINRYFEKYPQDSVEFARLAANESSLNPRKALIRDWYGGKTFHQEPFYVYLVALTYAVFGAQPWYVFCWQFLLGACINLLLFLLAARYTNYTTALIAGLLAVFCGPMLCYDMVLLRTTLTTFIFLAALWMFEQALDKPSPARCLSAGAVMALAVLTQSYAILFFILSLGLLWWRLKETPKTLYAAGMMLMGFFVVLAPVLYRNLVVGVSPLSIASIGGPAFIVANAKGTMADVPFMVVEESFVDIMHQTHGAMWATIGATLGTYDSFWDFLVFQFDKIRTVFFWYEMPNNMNYYLYQEMAPVLKFLPVTQFLLAPLCLVGMCVWAVERRKQCLPWLALWLVAMVPLLFGIALSRYRIGFMAVSIIPAAYAIVFVAKTLILSEFSKKALVLGGLGLAFLLTTKAVSHTNPDIGFQDYVQLYKLFYLDDLKRSNEANNYAECANIYGRFLSYEPVFLHKIGPARKLQSKEEKSIANMFMNIHLGYSDILKKLGREAQAQQELKQSETLNIAIRQFQ